MTPIKFSLPVCTAVVVASLASSAAENLTVLSALPGESAPGTMLGVSLEQQAYAAIDRRKAAFEKLKCPPASLLGRSFVGMRVEDVAAGTQFLKTFQAPPNKPNKLHILAIREATIPALVQ